MRNREFRGLVVAQVISECGEQIARIAMAVLVFRISHSTFYAALTYAVGFVPLIVGGAVLGPLADWLPRRQLMLACHAGRAVLVALIAIPGVPLALAFVLLALVSLLEAPFAAARTAINAEVLPDGPTYVSAVSLTRALNQIDQAMGFFLGGILLVLVGARGALLVDAAAYVVAYFVVLATVKHRAATTKHRSKSFFRDLTDGARVVFADPARRALAAVVWMGGLVLILPEGVAVSYADRHGGHEFATAVLTAAMPAGLFVGAITLARFVSPRRQTDLLLGLFAASCVFLAATAARPPIAVTAVLWFASGVCQAFVIPAMATFNLAVGPENRGRAIGLAVAGLSLVQAVDLAGGGALAAVIGPAAAVAWFGVAGLLGVALLRTWWPREALARVADQMLGAEPLPAVELALGTPDSGVAVADQKKADQKHVVDLADRVSRED
jgi:predicted MFS family arabinose efflux permease